MSVVLYDTLMARRLLLVQFTVVILFSAAFCINSQKWAISALFGGLSVCLPNALFFLLTKWCRGITERVLGVAVFYRRDSQDCTDCRTIGRCVSSIQGRAIARLYSLSGCVSGANSGAYSHKYFS